MTLDDDLIRRAQLWATGATIHVINTWIGLYRAAAANVERNSADEVKRQYGEQVLIAVSNRIAAFMQHSDEQKARRDWPLPVHPDDRRA